MPQTQIAERLTPEERREQMDAIAHYNLMKGYVNSVCTAIKNSEMPMSIKQIDSVVIHQRAKIKKPFKEEFMTMVQEKLKRWVQNDFTF